MPETYFDRIRAATGMRFWVNNPTSGEMDLALANGAMGCTTNPAYGGSLVRRAPGEVLPVVRECLSASHDDRVVADLVQQRLVGRISDRFADLFTSRDGTEGFVSIQGAPVADEDAKVILDQALAALTIAPNATPKIPATKAGLEAFDALVERGTPVIVTEVFSLAQLIETCNRWIATTRRTGIRPPFFLSPITGIFGDHLRKVATRERVDVPTSAIDMAGVLLSRRCYEVVRDRGYPVTLLYGGARAQFDFTGLVGGGMAATINWSTASELLAADLPAMSTITDPVEPEIERQLVDTFDDVRIALDPDAIALGDFEGFGPVQHFHDNFVAGWTAVLDMIAQERAATTVGA